jgi:phage nucleotide-binding protein
MKVYNTQDSQVKPSIVMLVYGEGGVGKTTFTATAPRPILADCENGAKYFGLRGIKMDVAQIQGWSDMREFLELAKSDQYDTVIIDPIGELMEKLRRSMVAQGDAKLVQKDGSPTMGGWGWLKKTLKDYIKVLRDTGKNVILVAHVEEKTDEDRLVKRPKIETKISDDLIAMVDIVGYFTIIVRDGEEKRVIIVDPSNDKYVAKDRTGQLGKYIPPNFAEIVEACQGTKQFSWSTPSKAIVYPEDRKEEKPIVAPEVTSELKEMAEEKAETTKGEKVAALKKKAAAKK